LLLWALLGRGGSSFQSQLGGKVNPKHRDALKKSGLIQVEKRGGKGFWLEVTDKGWSWASENLSAPLPAKAQAGTVLQAWLSRLQAYMRANNVALAEILSPGAGKAPPVNGAYDAMRERIRAAYRSLAGGAFNKRVLLRELRDRLSDVSREALDDALLKMAREEGTSLVELDNRREITGADRTAAIQIGGEPRHILWIRS
jgi:hypothetical protein